MHQIHKWKVIGQLAPKERYTWFFQLSWLLVFTMVFRGTFLPNRTRAVTEYAVVDANNLVNIVVTFVAAGLLAIKWQEVVLTVREGGMAVGCIVCYYLVCAASGLWSLTPEYSSYRAFEFLGIFLIVMILVRKMDCFLKAERSVLLCVNFMLLMQIIGSIRFGRWPPSGSNAHSMAGAMLLAYSFGELSFASGQRKCLLAVSLIIGLISVLLVASTGSNLGLLAALLMLVILSPSHRYYLLLLIPALLLVETWNPIVEVIGGGKSPDDILSLRHRLGVWTVSWELFLQRPLLGYGFDVATRHLFSILSAHNSYLGMLLSVGILGASILIFGNIVILRDLGCAMKSRSIGSIGCFAATIAYFINSFSRPGGGSILSIPNIVFPLVLALFIYHVKPTRRRVFLT